MRQNARLALAAAAAVHQPQGLLDPNVSDRLRAEQSTQSLALLSVDGPILHDHTHIEYVYIYICI